MRAVVVADQPAAANPCPHHSPRNAQALSDDIRTASDYAAQRCRCQALAATAHESAAALSADGRSRNTFEIFGREKKASFSVTLRNYHHVTCPAWTEEP